MKRLRQWVTAYISDWKIAAVTIAFVISLINFSFRWTSGCIPLPWVFPVPWIDAFLKTVVLPLPILLLTMILGSFISAVAQMLNRRAKRQWQGFYMFLVALVTSILLIAWFVDGVSELYKSGSDIDIDVSECPNTPIGKAHTLESALAMLAKAKLSPLPASASHLRTTYGGSLFSSTNSVYFHAPRGDIENWLKSSPRIKDLAFLNFPDGHSEYVAIKEESPVKGSSTKLSISPDRQTVKLETASWSFP